MGEMKKLINMFMVAMAVLTLASAATSLTKDLGNEKEPVIKEGYVRHVILWSLSEDLSDEEKLDVIMIAQSTMERFKNEIPGLVKADVIYKNRLDSSNCDFMFDMYFTSRVALEDFSVNPAHLEVVARLKPYITGRTCLDVEL